MFAGHFGLAAGIKSKVPEVPLWALMVSTQLLDIAFVPMLLGGAETIEETRPGGGYGEAVIHADYTHSLAGALLIALLAGLAAWRLWGRRASGIIAGIVFSHWLLDLVVHRSDMPLLPGNAMDLPLLGLGAWKSPGLSAVLELILIVGGLWLYARSALDKGRGAGRKAAVISSWVLGCALGLALVTDVTGWF
ncbi:permease [Paenibacillus sacheonensis]|uniref:Permease n=1 Tax=Paenibacillus sacheonensis TaxID=742054 RepID=A0A7X5BZG5_9BACL|nr:permease [Paenibacillus sacheonensis]MBM7566264.1 hypothetical protein [Paenibacillus sacheonensis]NBC70471.1 permease [Paenibacillus sacheonensis]